MSVYLKELIEALEKADPDYVAPIGLGSTHSYRGYYEDLAFEPKPNVSVREMLQEAKAAYGKAFTGYKGGEYEMGEYTTCWISRYGYADGDGIGPIMIGYLTGQHQ